MKSLLGRLRSYQEHGAAGAGAGAGADVGAGVGAGAGVSLCDVMKKATMKVKGMKLMNVIGHCKLDTNLYNSRYVSSIADAL